MAKRCCQSATRAIILCLAILSSVAQGTEPDCGPGESIDPICDEPSLELSRITVTATRRESPIGRVPVSVTALSGDMLRAMGAAEFTDYARSVPGLSFTELGVGGPKYVIRGVTTGLFAESRAATSMYLDETPMPLPGFFIYSYAPDPLLVDIDRIEVLRGPQGTLFGSGAMGGAIRVITNEPDPYAFESFGEAILSTTEHGGPGYELRAMLNAPSADNRSAVRIVAYYRELDGWIDNTFLAQRDVNNDEIGGLRLSGNWTDQDRLSITGKIIHQDRESDGSKIDQGNPPWTQQREVEEPNDDEWSLANLEINYAFDWGHLISTTSWVDRIVDSSQDSTAVYRNNLFSYFEPPADTTVNSVTHNDLEQFTQEFRLFSSSGDKLNWLLGLFYQNQEFKFSQDLPAPGFDAQTGGAAAFFGAPDKLLVGRADRSLRETAAFGDLVWTIDERWEFTAGGRWFLFEYDHVESATGLIVLGSMLEESTADESGFTPKLSLSYFHNHDITLYGTVANGYRPGGPNLTALGHIPGCPEQLAWLGLDGIPQLYESDSLWSYELGLKSGWADQQIYMNTAVYYIDWTDIQTPVGLSCGAGWLENAGAATSRGIEVELAAYPVTNLELTINGAFTDATLSEDLPRPNVGGADGDRLPGVPEYALGGSITWFFNAFEGLTSSIRADYQYVGSSYGAFGPGRLETPSHSLTNLRLNFRRNRWETSLFINNLFGNRAVITAYEDPIQSWVTTARPFTVGISARWMY